MSGTRLRRGSALGEGFVRLTVVGAALVIAAALVAVVVLRRLSSAADASPPVEPQT
jgi:hypothetical protein